MTDQMTRLQQEAERRYPVGGSIDLTYPAEALREHKRAAFIAGRTISAQQLEEAAKAAYYATGTPLSWDIASKPQRQNYRRIVRAALEAAGLVVEE